MGRKKKALADKIEKEMYPETNISRAAPPEETVVPSAEESPNISIFLEADILKEPAAEIEEESQLQARTSVLNDLPDNETDTSGDEQVAYNEVDFKVSTLLSAIANNGIIHSLCWLLKFYKSNSAATNHHILSILRRISDDLELSPMLYQVKVPLFF